MRAAVGPVVDELPRRVPAWISSLTRALATRKVRQAASAQSGGDSRLGEMAAAARQVSESTPETTSLMRVSGATKRGEVTGHAATGAPKQASPRDSRWTLVVIALSRGIIVGMQLVYTKMYVTGMSDRAIGNYWFWATLPFIATGILYLPIEYHLQSRIYEYSEKSDFLRYSLRVSSAATLPLAGICCIFALAILPRGSDLSLLVVAACAISITQFINTFFKDTILNLGFKKTAASVMAGESIIRVGCLWVAKVTIGVQPLSLLAVNAVTFLLTAATAFIVYLSMFGYTSARSRSMEIDWKAIVRFSYPLSGAAIVNWLQVNGYRLLLVPLGLAETVGIYSAVSNIGIAGMNAVATIYYQNNVPELYQSRGKSISLFLRNAWWLLAAAAIGAALVANAAVPILTRQNLQRYSSVVVLGVLVEGLNILISGMAVVFTLRATTQVTLRAALFAIAVEAAMFAAFYGTKILSIYSLGIPIVVGQLVVVALYYRELLAQTGRAAI